MTFRFIGYDRNGIKRVWGEAETDLDAAEQCQRAMREYAERRPECLPMVMRRETACEPAS